MTTYTVLPIDLAQEPVDRAEGERRRVRSQVHAYLTTLSQRAKLHAEVSHIIAKDISDEKGHQLHQSLK